MSRILTLQQLIDAKAREDQVSEFRERFGDSVEVTGALCRYVVKVFDLQWAARHLLSAPALTKYERITATDFCKDHGGVTTMNVFIFETVRCGDDKHSDIASVIDKRLKP